MSAGIQLKVDIDDQELRTALRKVAHRVTGLRPAFESIGQTLLTATRRRFETQSGPDGRAWKALAPSTIAARQRRNRRGSKRKAAMAALSGDNGLRILFVTGRLLGSLTYKATERAVAVGTNAKFPGGNYSRAAIHQLGGEPGMAPGPAAIPARPFLGVNSADQRVIARLLMRHMEAV